MNRPKRFHAVYSRVSTNRQDHAAQMQSVYQFCDRHGIGNRREFLDTCTGSSFTRTALEEMMAAVRQGQVESVIVYKLDRLGRSLPDLALMIQQLQAHNTPLICTSQGIDTSNRNPMAKMQIGMLMLIAEFERDLIRERIMSGLAAARSRGTKLGRKEKLSSRWSEVKALLDQGLGVRAVARKLNMPPSSICKLKKAAE